MGTDTYHYDDVGNILSITRSSGGSGKKPKKPHSPKPAISSVNPTQVDYGQSITITGRGFSPTAAEDVVDIGKLVAPVVSASADSLTVTAPPGRAAGWLCVPPAVPLGVRRWPSPPGQCRLYGRSSGPGPTAFHVARGTRHHRRLRIRGHQPRPAPRRGPDLHLQRLGRGQTSTTTGRADSFYRSRRGHHQLVVDGNHVPGQPLRHLR